MFAYRIITTPSMVYAKGILFQPTFIRTNTYPKYSESDPIKRPSAFVLIFRAMNLTKPNPFRLIEKWTIAMKINLLPDKHLRCSSIEMRKAKRGVTIIKEGGVE